MNKFFRIEYFFIFMVLIWIPLQRYVLKVDGAANTIAVLTIVIVATLWTKKNFYRTALRSPLIIWLIWILYAVSNTLIQGRQIELPFSSFVLNIFVPFILMAVITLEYERNQERVLNVLIFGLYFALMLIVSFDTVNEKNRIGGDLNSNSIGTMATVTCMLLYFKFYRKSYTLILFLIMTAIPIAIVISTGSRTAFGGIALLVALHFFLTRSSNILVTISKMALGALILILPFNFILENTTLGERLLSTTEQSQGMTIETGNPILDKFGDRGYFYYRGWEVFKENPIIGVGLNNFRHYNDLELAQHSEYMIQLTELGLVGFSLFFMFYLGIFRNLTAIKRVLYKSREVELYIGYTIIVLIMISATRMYQVWYFFAIIGIVVAFVNQQRCMRRQTN